jgi:hypothetical protein
MIINVINDNTFKCKNPYDFVKLKSIYEYVGKI